MLARGLPAEPVEFAVPHAAEEGAPFVRGKPENPAVGIPAVADANPAIRQVRYLDAIAVGQTQGALHPVRAGTPISGRNCSHVTSLLIVISENPAVSGDGEQPGSSPSPRPAPPRRPGQARTRGLDIACTKIVLQLAVQDIGQLTDFAGPGGPARALLSRIT